MAVTIEKSLQDFIDEVGTTDPVCVVGGRTQWSVGGRAAPSTREVRAPAGIVDYHPAEMTVRLGAGTTMAELEAALAAKGQTTVLEGAPDATVGGVLAVGRSGLRRLRVGPVRDALLQVRYVSADGRLITAGGPTVKNVSGYDLCKLMVGSLGTLGCFAEVILRTRPRPVAEQWWAVTGDPFAVTAPLYRPSTVLWDGETTWVHLEGHVADVTAQGEIIARAGGSSCSGPPELPPVRSSIAPSSLATAVRSGDAGHCVVEIGVGVVHGQRALPRPAPSAAVVELHRRIRHEFDPAQRLNPGRDALRALEGPSGPSERDR
ncbi:MAG: FAD-binding protein [Acidimicrobiales bacterium]